MFLKRFSFIFAFLIAKGTTAQVPASVIKISAFSQEVQMGNIPVDADGKPLDNGHSKNYFLIIETKGTRLPEWTMAYLSGAPYTLSPTDSTKSDKDEIMAARGKVMKANAGNKLWKYELIPADLPQKKCDSKTAQLMLEGNYNKKKITLPIKTIITLEPELRP